MGHRTLWQLTHSHTLGVFLPLLDRRSWQCLLHPGSQPGEHQEPLSPTKNSSKLIKCCPSKHEQVQTSLKQELKLE